MSAPFKSVHHDCAICMENVHRHDSTRLMCDHCDQHFFHSECILWWFRTKATCPTCRTVFPQAEIRRLQKQSQSTCYSAKAADETVDRINVQIALLHKDLGRQHTRQGRKQIQSAITQLMVVCDGLSKSM
jgi:hypothetical protein